MLDLVNYRNNMDVARHFCQLSLVEPIGLYNHTKGRKDFTSASRCGHLILWAEVFVSVADVGVPSRSC